MYKFVTKFGSYTLVLKPKGDVPIYDHKGTAKRVDGIIYAEFKHQKGTSIGMYETDDEVIADHLRNHSRFGKAFTELKKDEVIERTPELLDKSIQLPKTALMACNRNELIDLAVKYGVDVEDSATKKEIVEAIFNQQTKAEQPKTEQATENVTSLEQPAIKQIIQKKESE